jgi:type I restriction enzyme, R subunit
LNLAAGTGVAIREFRMAPGHGFADYLLFVNGKVVGVRPARSPRWVRETTKARAES